MKATVTLVLLAGLLVCLPIAHIILVFSILDTLVWQANEKSMFVLFTIPAWACIIVIFIIEVYRRGFLQPLPPLQYAVMLGLAGMLAPCIAILISPVGSSVSNSIYAVTAVSGLGLGIIAGLVFVLLSNSVKGR